MTTLNDAEHCAQTSIWILHNTVEAADYLSHGADNWATTWLPMAVSFSNYIHAFEFPRPMGPPVYCSEVLIVYGLEPSTTCY
jgi:hypothetical protein